MHKLVLDEEYECLIINCTLLKLLQNGLKIWLS